MARASWLDDPRRVAAVVAVVALSFVIARWQIAAHGDISRFIGVGSSNTVPPGPQGVHVAKGPGYDGEFYYRFALNPGRLDGVVNGIRLDTGLRRQRILYPFLAWMLSLGMASWVPAALVLVNLVAVAVLGWLGARLAQDYGLHAAWGLLFAGFAGFVSSLGRDLTELVSAALIAWALLALSRHRVIAATVALSLGVLTRETVVAVVGGIAVWRIWSIVRRRSRAGLVDLTWSVPMVVYLLWQAATRLQYGAAPLQQESGNGGVPVWPALRSLLRAARHPNGTNAIFVLGVLSLGALATLALQRGRAAGSGAVPGYLRLGVLFLAVLGICLSGDVWNRDPNELRTFAELHVLGLAALVSAQRRRALMLYAAVAVPTLIAFAVYSVIVI